MQAHKPNWEKLLAYVRSDDTIVIWRLDRLGRSTKHLIGLVEDLSRRGLHLILLQDFIDRTSKVAFAELHPRAKRVVAADFLRCVLDNLPHKVHAVLTDNGVQFTPQPHQFLPGGHRFDRICREYGVEHRLTKPAHPWDQWPSRAHEPHD